MAKNLQRKKPGYTKSGEVKLVSLSYKQLYELNEKTSKPKIRAKIQNCMRALAGRKGFVNPVQLQETVTEAVAE